LGDDDHTASRTLNTFLYPELASLPDRVFPSQYEFTKR
jgi:hypothetical protein